MTPLRKYKNWSKCQCCLLLFMDRSISAPNITVY